MEWLALILVAALVWCTELLNTALEWLCDYLELRPDDKIRDIKDVAAGAVLIAALAALAVGAIVFVPKIFP